MLEITGQTVLWAMNAELRDNQFETDIDRAVKVFCEAGANHDYTQNRHWFLLFCSRILDSIWPIRKETRQIDIGRRVEVLASAYLGFIDKFANAEIVPMGNGQTLWFDFFIGEKFFTLQIIEDPSDQYQNRPAKLRATVTDKSTGKKYSQVLEGRSLTECHLYYGSEYTEYLDNNPQAGFTKSTYTDLPLPDGYTKEDECYVRDADGNLVPWS